MRLGRLPIEHITIVVNLSADSNAATAMSAINGVSIEALALKIPHR